MRPAPAADNYSGCALASALLGVRAHNPWCGPGWSYSGGSVVSPRPAGGARETVTVLHRYHFSSALKRMAALVRVRRVPGFLQCGTCG